MFDIYCNLPWQCKISCSDPVHQIHHWFNAITTQRHVEIKSNYLEVGKRKAACHIVNLLTNIGVKFLYNVVVILR